MLGIGPELVREVRARRLCWTLWVPLICAPVLCFLFVWMAGRIEQPLGEAFWLSCTIWHGYILAWILYFGAVPPSGLSSTWMYRHAHPFAYWTTVASLVAVVALFVGLTYS